jgi:peroxiredoxin
MRPASSLLAAGLILLVACTSSLRTELDETIVRDVHVPLPTLEGDGLDGAPLSSTGFDGSILVVNTWATWCSPCGGEQGELVRVARAYTGRGVSFLGVNYADQRAAASTWVRRYDVPYPSIADPSGSIAAVLGIVGLPNTFVVDPAGTIRFIVNGPTTERQLSRLIDRVLAEDASG